MFSGGVFPSERGQVWRFLFGVYPCGSTMSERSLLHEQLAVRYHAMKRKWQQLLPAAVCMRLNGTDGTPCFMSLLVCLVGCTKKPSSTSYSLMHGV